MTHRILSVTREENGWRVRLNGVDVVSFFGPNAQDWAFRERDELAQVLDAQPSDDLSHSHGRAHPFEIVR
jgi:hypothetical protein